MSQTIEIVRVKFRWPGKMYEFVNSQNLSLKRSDKVVVEGYNHSSMVGTVSIPPRIRVRRKEDDQLTSVLRLATSQDLVLETVNDEFRMELKRFFETRLSAYQIPGVRMVDCEKADGGRTLIIYYHSEQRRFDAKAFAKELGQRFNSRIDMRSVGIRDAARLAGGIGKCGLSLCCSTWLPDFNGVSIRMAKDQGLSLDPDSINGQCGRLLCCLGYEHQNYLELGKSLPKVGKTVVTPAGDARVVKLDILKGLVTVRTEEGAYETYEGTQVKRKFGPGQSSQAQVDDSDQDSPEDNEIQ